MASQLSQSNHKKLGIKRYIKRNNSCKKKKKNLFTIPCTTYIQFSTMMLSVTYPIIIYLQKQGNV